MVRCNKILQRTIDFQESGFEFVLNVLYRTDGFFAHGLGLFGQRINLIADVFGLQFQRCIVSM